MKDTYQMILWARAREDSIDNQAEQVFNILTTLNKIDYLKPRYQTVRRKRDAVEFDLTFENIRNLIIKKRDKQFPYLGSLIGFFSSLNNDEATGTSISIGVSNPRFINSVVINLNRDYKEMELEKYDELEWLFKTLIVQFKPYYGCVVSRSIGDKYDGYYNNAKDIPKSIYDLNYWGRDIVEKLKITEEKLLNIYDYEEIDEGYYLRFQKKPMDALNEAHMRLQKKINCLLRV